MLNIISASQALAQGINPTELEHVAAWHEERANEVSVALKRPSGRLRGDVVTEFDRQRHLNVGQQLRAVARQIAA